jgi:hypothetical protein
VDGTVLEAWGSHKSFQKKDGSDDDHGGGGGGRNRHVDFRGAPLEITILAQPSPVASLPVPSLSFVLVTDEGRRLDLIAKGMATRVLSQGDACCSDEILARLDVPTLRTLARSKRIRAHVLALDGVLDADDMRAVAEFALLVLPPEGSTPSSKPQ